MREPGFLLVQGCSGFSAILSEQTRALSHVLVFVQAPGRSRCPCVIWLADQQKRYADDMDVNELAALRDRLGLDDVTVCQADDPAGYARRWRIRTGRVTSVLLSVREARELLDLAEKVVRPISPAPMDVFTKGE